MDLPTDLSVPLTGSFCMQHAGWKTPEKAISVELLQDFSSKSLFNTLFMMFNSRYQGVTVHKVLPQTTRQRIGRMYYILNAGGPIKHFAVIRREGSTPRVTKSGDEEENTDKKEVGSWKPTVSFIFFRDFCFF
jgi:hypothetical protein